MSGHDATRLHRRSVTDCLTIERYASDRVMPVEQRMALIADVVREYEANLTAVPLWRAISTRALTEGRNRLARRATDR